MYALFVRMPAFPMGGDRESFIFMYSLLVSIHAEAEGQPSLAS